MRTSTQIANASKRVLVIEGDKELLRRRCRSLQAEGWQTTGITETSEAPRQWPSHLYDLVVIGSHGDPVAALEFCASVKKCNPAVVIAMLRTLPLSLPTTCAPDVVITDNNETAAGLRLQALMRAL